MIELLIRRHYRVVGLMPSKAQPTDPLDLPQAVLALSGVKTAVQMRAVLTIMGPLVEACEDEDFDRFMARSVKATLRSKGTSTQQLEVAMAMGTVVTEFQRGWDEVRELGREEGQVAVRFSRSRGSSARRPQTNRSSCLWKAAAGIGSPCFPPQSSTAKHLKTSWHACGRIDVSRPQPALQGMSG